MKFVPKQFTSRIVMKTILEKAIKYTNIKLLRKAKGVMIPIFETPKMIESTTVDFPQECDQEISRQNRSRSSFGRKNNLCLSQEVCQSTITEGSENHCT